jgi:hypothetical protein
MAPIKGSGADRRRSFAPINSGADQAPIAGADQIWRRSK